MRAWTALACGSLALLLSSACARSGRAGSLPHAALLADSERPALFLGPEPGAAQVGYLSDDVVLELSGPEEQGRVPVRVEGPLRTRGYVAADQLSLRVQRRGRVRGTPVYLGPGDRVRVLGSAAGEQRLQVEVTPRLGQRVLGRYEGSFPEAGLAVTPVARGAAEPEPGVPYRVPAQLAVVLFEQPAAAGTPPGTALTELAAQAAPYEVRVVRAVEGWLAVRAGSGPYLIGWTQAALQPLPVLAPALVLPVAQPAGDAVPSRLANEQGELRRIAAGSEVRFGERVIGVFRAPGYARVQRVFEGGFVDVFAAADEGVALRGVVRAADLSEISTPAAAR